MSGAALRLPPGSLLLSPAGVAAIRRALNPVIAKAIERGEKIDPVLREVLTEMRDAMGDASVMSARGPVSRPQADISAHLEVSVPEAADLIGASERHMRRLAESGELPGRKVGQVWLLLRDDVLAYARNRRAA